MIDTAQELNDPWFKLCSIIHINVPEGDCFIG